MKDVSRNFTKAFAVLTFVSIMSSASSIVCAQSIGVSSKPLARTTLSGDDTKEAIMLVVEFAPGGGTGRHTHPGDEYTFVLQGTLEISGEGRETRRVSAGDVYHNPSGLIHEARNVGDSTARVNITFILDKGKPISTPVTK
jgi:quercetin dioxygenase-like cupin family protein